MKKGSSLKQVQFGRKGKAILLVAVLTAAFGLGYIVHDIIPLTPLYTDDWPATASYVVKTDGAGNYWAVRSDGKIPSEMKGTNISQLTQNVINGLTSSGGLVYLKGIQLPQDIILSSNVAIEEEYQGKITFYKTRTYMWYCGSRYFREGLSVEQLALAIADKKLEDLATDGDTSNWKKCGVVLSPTGWEGNYSDEPNVLYENGIFKMWYSASSIGGTSYAESTDGISWIKYDGNPIIPGFGRPYVLKENGQYWLYATNVAAPSSFNLYIGNNETNLQPYAGNPVLIKGSIGQWDSYYLGNLAVWKEGSNWYMIYDAVGPAALWKLGLAFSSDGKSWTKYSGNPVLDRSPACAGGPWIQKIGNTYYMWFHGSPVSGNLPTNIYKCQSIDLHSWTDEKLVLNRTMSFEGSQVSDPTLLSMIYQYTIPPS